MHRHGFQDSCLCRLSITGCWPIVPAMAVLGIKAWSHLKVTLFVSNHECWGERVIIPWLNFLVASRDIIVTTTTVTKFLALGNRWTRQRLRMLEMWWILEAGIPLTLWYLWNQWISNSSRRYPKKIVFYLATSRHSLTKFTGPFAVILCKRFSSRCPSSYRFPEGTTMVNTEDDFNVCLGMLLDGWDVCKGTGFRPLWHTMSSRCLGFSNLQTWEGPMVR